MSFHASELGLRVVIEGVRVPAIGATVTYVEGRPATAQVRLPPARKFTCIKPRSLVHIFYLTENTSEDSSAFFTDVFKEKTEGQKSDPASENRNASKAGFVGRRYKHLFTGEYTAYSFAKTVQGRALVLECVDATNYLSAIKQGASNYKSGGFEQIEQAFLGTQRDKDDRTFFGKDLSDNMTKWLGGTKHYEIGSETPTSYDPNPGTQNAKNTGNTNTSGWRTTKATNVITGLHRAILTSFCTSNVFYAKQLNRNRVPDLFVGLRGDTTADKLFDAKVFKKWIKHRIAGGRGQYKTLAEVIQQVMSVLMYNMVTIPSPKMVKTYKRGERMKPYNDWVSWKNEGTEGGLGNFNYGPMREHHKGTSLNTHLIKPDFWYFPPPACNIIFPDQYINFSYGRNFIAEPTRMLMRTQTMLKSVGKRQTKNSYSERALVSGVIFSTTSYGSSGLKHLAERTYAPDFDAFKALLDKKQGYRAQLYSVVMPHEKFVGPNTIFTWEGDMGGFGSKASRAEYLRMFTDYLFWKVYFSSRSGSLDMPFNPQVVPGFSCLVLDEMDNLPEGESPFKDNKYNPKGNFGDHHYGYIQAVTHDIGQNGATTRLQLVGLRHFEEDVDFDGIEYGTQGYDRFDQVAFEDVVVRPMRDYLDPRYHSENIGKQFYYPMIGCTSILDKVSGVKPDIHKGEVATKGGTLSMRDAAKRLEFMYRSQFVDGPMRRAADNNPKKNNPIVKMGDRNSFVNDLTKRQGIPGECDIIGTATYSFNIYHARWQSGNDKFMSATAEGLQGFINDPEEQAVLSLQNANRDDVLRNQESFLNATIPNLEDAGFYEASYNPVLRARVLRPEKGIPDTPTLRGFTGKILEPSDQVLSRDIFMSYFQQETKRNGTNTTKVADTRTVPYRNVAGLSSWDLEVRSFLLVKSEKDILEMIDNGDSFAFTSPSAPGETTIISPEDVVRIAQVQSTAHPDKKTPSYTVNAKVFSFNLREEMLIRRKCVIEYVNSLALKGLR